MNEIVGAVARFEAGSFSVGIFAPQNILQDIDVAPIIPAQQDRSFPPYDLDAWVPGDDWVAWRPEHISLADCAVYVCPFGLPELVELRSVLRGVVSQEQVDHCLELGAFSLSNRFAARVGTICTKPQHVRLLGVSAGDPGRRTATVDPRTGSRIGLHLDDWDRADDVHRGSARTRICVNLGYETREFLMVPVALHAATRECRSVFNLRNLRGTDAARKLMSVLRPTALRIPVPPLYAYVAPTETLIHDASTLRMTSTDLCLTVLGHVQLDCLNALTASVKAAESGKSDQK